MFPIFNNPAFDAFFPDELNELERRVKDSERAGRAVTITWCLQVLSYIRTAQRRKDNAFLS